MERTPTDKQKQRYADAVEALNKADWGRAQHIAMHLLREIPPHAGVYFVAGVAALHLQQLPLAITCLRRTVALNPGRADYMAQLARSLAMTSLTAEATEIADKARALSPGDAMTLDTLGVVYTQANAYALAAEMFRHVIELEPAQASYRFNYATSLVFSGDIDRAEEELETCLALEPRYWKAYLTLVQLRKQGNGSNHIPRLQTMLAQVGDDADGAMYLNLALAKVQEDLAEYPKAFASLVRGKSVGHDRRAYASVRDEALFDAIQQSFRGAVPAAEGHRSQEPIFIFGMPRTGTTLVERIISSHPSVQSAGELQDFGVALKRASGSRTAELLDIDTMTRGAGVDWKSLGQSYLASTKSRTGGRAHFIDKLPHNFLYAGFIANALPDAKLICVRRDPVDTCLSNFRQLFSQNSTYYDYSFDLLDTGRYYLLFDRLMAYWQQKLHGRILEIEYEAIVEQQEESTRRLLDFCGVGWHEDCLRFEENPAPVATASAVQVRAPMYRSSVRRWRHYEPQLADLLQLFDAAGIGYGGRNATKMT